MKDLPPVTHPHPLAATHLDSKAGKPAFFAFGM